MSSIHPARHLLRAKDLADGRYFEPLSVAALAAAAGLSPAQSKPLSNGVLVLRYAPAA